MVGDPEPSDEPEPDASETPVQGDWPAGDALPASDIDLDDADLLGDADDLPDVDGPADVEGDGPADADADAADGPDDAAESGADAALLASGEARDQGDDAGLEPVVVEPWQPPVRRHRWLARLIGVAALAVPTIIAGSVALRATGLDPGAKVDERLVGALRYDGKGNPLVRAPKADVGSVQRREWRVCGKSCDAISGRGKEFRPGEVLAGSRVEVRVVGTSGEARIGTPGWDGQLKALRRPTITGSARIGGSVEANPGKWTGGWLDAEIYTGLRACPTRQGGGRCIAFTVSALGMSDTSKRTIPAAFRGWWIGAIEWHVPPGREVTARAEQDPATPQDGERAPTPGATVKVGPLDGPIR